VNKIPEEAKAYVERLRRQGAEDSQIQKALRDAGWSQDQIADLLANDNSHDSEASDEDAGRGWGWILDDTDLYEEVRAIRDQNKCRICGILGDPSWISVQVHHIVPKAQGGADSPENAITLCASCHTFVHTKFSGAKAAGVSDPYRYAVVQAIVETAQVGKHKLSESHVGRPPPYRQAYDYADLQDQPVEERVDFALSMIDVSVPGWHAGLTMADFLQRIAHRYGLRVSEVAHRWLGDETEIERASRCPSEGRDTPHSFWVKGPKWEGSGSSKKNTELFPAGSVWRIRCVAKAETPEFAFLSVDVMTPPDELEESFYMDADTGVGKEEITYVYAPDASEHFLKIHTSDLVYWSITVEFPEESSRES